LKSCAGGVHNQLWQKTLWKETAESLLAHDLAMFEKRNPDTARNHLFTEAFDYRVLSGENKSSNPPRLAVVDVWACGAAGSALPWHGRGRRFDPDQVHQTSQQLR
jgi:hypothetical protein